MQIYDTHVHTTFSADGVSSLEDYARRVKEGIINGIGFAEHIDFLPECGSYGFLEPAVYIKAVEEYRNSGYEFFAGAEIDYAKQVEDEILQNINKYKYAFTICSVHLVDHITVSNKVSLPEIRDRQLLRKLILGYYKELENCLKVPEFDVIGHIGVYMRYLGRDFHEDKELINEINEIENEIALLCAKTNKIVEVNTSGLYSPLSATVPGINFLKHYYRHGGRYISVGSDAHSAAHVARGFETAFEMLRKLGFRYILLPWDREKPIML